MCLFFSTGRVRRLHALLPASVESCFPRHTLRMPGTCSSTCASQGAAPRRVQRRAEARLHRRDRMGLRLAADRLATTGRCSGWLTALFGGYPALASAFWLRRYVSSSSCPSRGRPRGWNTSGHGDRVEVVDGAMSRRRSTESCKPTAALLTMASPRARLRDVEWCHSAARRRRGLPSPRAGSERSRTALFNTARLSPNFRPSDISRAASRPPR